MARGRETFYYRALKRPCFSATEMIISQVHALFLHSEILFESFNKNGKSELHLQQLLNMFLMALKLCTHRRSVSQGLRRESQSHVFTGKSQLSLRTCFFCTVFLKVVREFAKTREYDTVREILEKDSKAMVIPLA